MPYLEAAMAASGAGDMAIEDVVATLITLTARTIADAVAAAGGTSVIASGGGTQNPTLMPVLAKELAGVELLTSDQLGLPSSAKEACAFALLGYLTLNNFPGTVAGCTGARHASILGSITPGSRGLSLPDSMSTAPTMLRIIGSSPLG